MEESEVLENVKVETDDRSLLCVPPPISKEPKSEEVDDLNGSLTKSEAPLLSSDQTSSQLVELVQNLGHASRY